MPAAEIDEDRGDEMVERGPLFGTESVEPYVDEEEEEDGTAAAAAMVTLDSFNSSSSMICDSAEWKREVAASSSPSS